MTARSTYRQDVNELKEVLLAAASERDKRRDFDPVTQELGWVLHERGVMHDTVNKLRARYGKPPASAEAVLSVETSASGHIDYAMKYALGCADLVHDRGPHSLVSL